MIDDIRQELKQRGGKAVEALKREFSRLRTGRAHVGILDGIRIDYYGSATALNQVATLNVPEPRLITIKVWDKSAVPLVEKAIRTSDLGLNPQSDGELIRIPVPPLTEERRRELAKLARARAEEARVSVRNARREANDTIKELENEGEISEDEARRGLDQVQKDTDALVARIDAVLAEKEEEILEV